MTSPAKLLAEPITSVSLMQLMEFYRLKGLNCSCTVMTSPKTSLLEVSFANIKFVVISSAIDINLSIMKDGRIVTTARIKNFYDFRDTLNFWVDSERKSKKICIADIIYFNVSEFYEYIKKPVEN